MNQIDNVTFTGVKYTAAGKEFVKSQSKQVQDLLLNAEKKMKKYKYTNLVVNSDGYAIQYANADGIHSCKINNVLYSCDDDVTYYVSGICDKFKFPLGLNTKKGHQCALASANDAAEKNSWLNSSIMLTHLLEQKGGYPIKKTLLDRIKEIIIKYSRLD